MAIKVTLLFQLATNVDYPTVKDHRIAGWSETWYQPGGTIPQALALLINPQTTSPLVPLALARAALLPQGAAIVGARFQTVNPPGPSQSIALSLPGSAGQADVPQMALLMSAAGIGLGNIRHFTLRGIPDAVVTEGEQNINGVNNFPFQTFVKSLAGWYFQGRDLSQPRVKILIGTSQGNFTTETPPLFAPNTMIRMARLQVVGSNKSIGGRFQVNSVGPGNVFTVNGWSGQLTAGGSARGDGQVYPQVDVNNVFPTRIVVRKVGRPFGQYRGRRSAKKR